MPLPDLVLQFLISFLAAGNQAIIFLQFFRGLKCMVIKLNHEAVLRTLFLIDKDNKWSCVWEHIFRRAVAALHKCMHLTVNMHLHISSNCYVGLINT